MCLKPWNICTLWCGSLPKKILLNIVTANASRHNMHSVYSRGSYSVQQDLVVFYKDSMQNPCIVKKYTYGVEHVNRPTQSTEFLCLFLAASMRIRFKTASHSEYACSCAHIHIHTAHN